MFWKKSRNKGEDSKKLFISPEEIRESFRVVPSSNSPIELTLDNKCVSVLDISSGGLCCENSNFEIGNLCSFHFFLPGITRKISGKIEILEITEKNLCHCQFRGLAPEYENHIHRYTLNRQKEELENKKRRPSLKDN